MATKKGDAASGQKEKGSRYTVALAVTGSIAAYKSAQIARLLIKDGARVIPIMTGSATQFLGAATLSGITGEAVGGDMWDETFPGEMHVAIADEIDVLGIAPATADAIARLASGRANDLMTALALVSKSPVIVAPAMHPRMWAHPATQANVATLLKQERVLFVGPAHGEVASGDVGLGRMSEPEEIVHAIRDVLTEKDWLGKRVLVTAGPTLEDQDPVRFLGNRSTGKMGFAIAERAYARGADVTLIAGPVSLPTPLGVTRIDVRSAREMREAMWEVMRDDLSGVDSVVMAAAVADYRFAETLSAKAKKQGDRAAIDLVRNPDLIGEVGLARKKKPTPLLVAFALETLTGAKLIAEARRKLASKKVDLVVANVAEDAFGKDDNRVTLVTAKQAIALPLSTKSQVADMLLDSLASALARRTRLTKDA